MHVGTRVRVMDKNEYNGRFFNMTGTVVHSNGSTYFGGTKICVKIDDIDNSRSKYNGYWFAAVRCKRIDETPIQLTGDYITVHAREVNKGEEGHIIEAACFEEDNIHVGDMAVLLDGTRMTLVHIVKVTEEYREPIPAGRQIIAKVSFADYHTREKTRKRIATLESDINHTVKKLKEQGLYHLIAERDPEMKAMLDEYLEIVKELPHLQKGE